MPITRSTLTATLAAALLTSGCQPAMSNQPRETSQMGIGHEYPLRFDHHTFSAHCFNTRTCRVTYAGTLQVDEQAVSRAPPANHGKRLGLGGHVGIDNFPEPAEVQWTALDGTALTASVAIGNIFQDQLVLHRVSKNELPSETVKHSGAPNIILEVNDRTLTVYMRAMVFLKDNGQSPGPFRDDVIQAWRKTY